MVTDSPRPQLHSPLVRPLESLLHSQNNPSLPLFSNTTSLNCFFFSWIHPENKVWQTWASIKSLLLASLCVVLEKSLNLSVPCLNFLVRGREKPVLVKNPVVKVFQSSVFSPWHRVNQGNDILLNFSSLSHLLKSFHLLGLGVLPKEDQKGASDALKLELEVAISHHMGAKNQT